MKITEQEKTGLLFNLTQKIEEFMEQETNDDHNIGYLPTNIEHLMAQAAFSVLMAVTATNEYFEDNDMIKP